MAELKFGDASRLSHAYIVTAGSPEEALRAARQIAAAAVCLRGRDVPCGECRACRKALTGIHPDITLVSRLTDDKGRKKREIGVDQIRAVITDAYVLPNEAERKVYIIDEADAMNVPAQNAALKLLEEPPKDVLFLLCTVNAQQLLPTVRSRCAEIDLGGDGAAADEETEKLTRAFIRAAASGDRAKLFAWCAKNETMDARAAADFLECAGELTADMLCLRRDALGMSREELTRLNALTARCLGYLKVNTGVKHIFGLLAADAVAGGGNRGK